MNPDVMNTDLLNKMGWITYSLSRGVGDLNLFVDDEMVKYFLYEGENLYVIKETNSFEYLFIKVINPTNPIPKMEISKFSDNQSMLSLILENFAFSKEYKRLLKLSSIS